MYFRTKKLILSPLLTVIPKAWSLPSCCFLRQEPFSHSSQVIKWVPAIKGNKMGTDCKRWPCYGIASYPGGVAVLSVVLCFRNRVKLRPCGCPVAGLRLYSSAVAL